MDVHNDVKKSQINPLVHYLRFGINEGRLYRHVKSNLEGIPENGDKALLERIYDTIYDSLGFDIDYYLKENNVEDLDYDPILHYILHGAKLGYSPSATFDLEKYANGNGYDKLDANPLYNQIVCNNGRGSGTFLKSQNIPVDFDSKYNYTTSINILDHLKKTVSVVIPIYNAYEETKECIESVLLNTNINYELILINDCSSDPRIEELLSHLEPIPFVKIIRNKENKGFVKNVNIGFKNSENDVVLLNSDTIVTPKWLSQLVFSAYTRPDIATVTPISNSSDISIKELAAVKSRKFLNQSAYQVNKINGNNFLSSPTGNGFCLYIKRKVIDEIGGFDEIFGMGYGEETDFTSRAVKHGWTNIRNPSVFVYHRRHASFSSDTANEFKVKNKEIIKQRHPEVYSNWDEFVKSPEFIGTLDNIRKNLQPNKRAEQILYVTTIKDGKILFDDRFYALASKYECYILAIEEHGLHLKAYDCIKGTADIKSWHIDDVADDSLITLYFNIFSNLKLDLVCFKNFKSYFHYTLSNLSAFVNFAARLEIPLLFEKFYGKGNIAAEVDKLLNPDKSFDGIIKDKEYIDFKDKKVVVYTALTGDYDRLITPSVVEDDFDYICFTDNRNLKSDFWQIRYMDDSSLDGVRKARSYKVLPHKYLQEYDYSIWIDTNFDITGSLKEYINKYSKNHKLLAIRHEERDCIYDEAEACKKAGKDSPEVIDKQMERYQNEGYPKHHGLIASGILFRDHHDMQVVKVMDDWHDEIVNNSRRDQLSFNYACWKNSFQYDESRIFYYKNEYFLRYDHLSNKPVKLIYAEDTVTNILDSLDKKTTIIIPVMDVDEKLKDCIESIIRNTKLPYDILLINNSKLETLSEFISSYTGKCGIKIIDNQLRLDFTKSINLGLEYIDNDAVWLKYDTIVTNKWLEKLRTKAYSRNKIATVSPVSNNAGTCSVPKLNCNNKVDEDFGIENTAFVVDKAGNNQTINNSIGNGICMFVKKEAIDTVGLLDLGFESAALAAGDYCMRLKNAGWINAMETSAYVYNNSGEEYGKGITGQQEDYLNNKHPAFNEDKSDLMLSVKYKNMRNKIGSILSAENKEQFTRKKVLYLTHEGKGGTLYTTVDLMNNVYEDMDVYLLTASAADIKLYRYSRPVSQDNVDDEFKDQLQTMDQYNIKTVYSLKNFHIKEFGRIYYNIIKLFKIDLVHIRHLRRNSFDLPYIAKKLGIPVVLSFHDFYYICPAHNLIDNFNNYCKGHCTPIDEGAKQKQCFITSNLRAPTLKGYVETWRGKVRDMFKCCDRFVTTSQTTYDLYAEFFPEIDNENFKIIEHGRDLETPDTIAVPKIESGKPIRLLIPGNIGISKGGYFIKDLKEQDVDNRIELHTLGVFSPYFNLEELAVNHGPYKRSEYCKEVNKIKPHAIGIFSIWPETYCHTLTESWSCGLPVISFDLGAVGERIKRHGGGFLISENPGEAYKEILDIFDDYDRYSKVSKEISGIEFKSTKKMGNQYLEIYNELLE